MNFSVYTYSMFIIVNFGIVATLGCHAAFGFAGGQIYLPYLAMVKEISLFH